MSFLPEEIYDKIKFELDSPFIYKNCFNYQNILSWEDINNYINNFFNYIPDQISVIDNDGFKKNFNYLKIPYDRIFRYPLKELVEDINGGSSFIIHNFTRFNKKINDIASEIENIFDGISLDFHVYAGLSENCRSFSIHKDTSYNFIFQLDGQSHWKVYNRNDGIPYSNFEHDDDLELLIDDILTPGDLIYIPVGNYHKCIPLGKRISISSCFVPKSLGMDKRPQEWYTLNY